MENILRVREITKRKQNARYHNVELGAAGSNSARGVITPCMIKSLADGTAENISFVPDTPHNRSLFLQRPGVEVAVHEDGKWVCVDRKWLVGAFAPAEGSHIKTPVAEAPPKPDKPIDINSYEDFSKLHKNTQGKAFSALMASKAEELKKQIVDGIQTNKDDPLLAKSVVELALKY